MTLSKMEIESQVIEAIDHFTEKYTKDFERIAGEMYKNPEVAFEEKFAHDLIASYFESFGEFKVTRHAYGVQTAFEVLFENGGRTVNFNAELDALPEIGHGCGHNLIAAGSCAAFLVLVRVLQKFNMPGSVQLLGTPAEESLGGKCHLLKGGAYKNVDVSFMSHPIATNGLDMIMVPSIFLATSYREYEFTGKSAHAAAFPWEGVNALDACVASWVNVSLLRQQIKPHERIHGFFKDGPTVANVIPESAKVVFQFRSKTRKELESLASRVENCCNAAALATGCTMKSKEVFCYLDMIQVPSLIEACYESTKKYAQTDTQVLSENSIMKDIYGSSDIGNVSQEIPAIHLVYSIPTLENCAQHSHVFAQSAGQLSTSMPPTLITAKSNALSAFKVLQDDGLYAKVEKEHKAQVKY
ncbi:Peptidase M20 domain-containing protein 2 [Meyerozyma sp. JA9]|nr:Peptidase M20 domain-containing protein 2 [Meyerozyma sp. JA9]